MSRATMTKSSKKAETGGVTLPIIDFVAPMPGFPGHRQFLLVRLDEDGLVYWLTAALDPAVRFLVVPPLPFFPDYVPEIDDETARLLDLSEGGNALLLVVVNAGESNKDSTANLMAPIVIDQRARRAVQVVLSGSGMPVRATLLTEAPPGEGS